MNTPAQEHGPPGPYLPWQDRPFAPAPSRGNPALRISPVTTVSVIKPPRLRPGGRIGVISPAGPVEESELQAGLENLTLAGFEIRLASHVYARKEYLAGGDEGRLADLHAMFRDRQINAIFCTRGGYGTLRLLQKVDYPMIRKNPKILMGYSDITALLLAVHKKTGLVTFHGPTVRDLASGGAEDLRRLLQPLQKNHPLRLTLGERSALIPGRAQGPLIGGNLTMLCHLLGTPFFPSLTGRILFLEDRGEPLYRIDRMITHLRLSGRVEGIAGIALGRFEECGEDTALHELFRERFLDLQVPVATGLPVGHGESNSILPLGLSAELDTERMTLTIASVTNEKKG